MGSSKEFFDRLANDEKFAEEISAEIKARRDSGAANYYETFIPVAEAHGYEVTQEDLDEIYDAQIAEMSEEELGKVAGGTSCLPATVSLWVMTILGTIVTSIGVTLEVEGTYDDPET